MTVTCSLKSNQLKLIKLPQSLLPSSSCYNPCSCVTSSQPENCLLGWLVLGSFPFFFFLLSIVLALFRGIQSQSQQEVVNTNMGKAWVGKMKSSRTRAAMEMFDDQLKWILDFFSWINQRLQHLSSIYILG